VKRATLHAVHLMADTLEAGVDVIRAAPADFGTLDLIVRRPAVDEREVLDVGELDLAVGLVGDTWAQRPSSSTPDGMAHPGKQLNVMSARAIALVSPDRSRWPLAGDQLFLDLDLGVANLPAGTQLAIGDAVIEITPHLHTGCAKFSERFGADALRFVNSMVGKELRLRGACARVVVPGTIRQGDTVRKTTNSTQ